MEFDCLDTEALIGFDCDDGNVYIEKVFFNEPLLIVEDFQHSEDECRCIAFGRDNKNNKIMVVFTVRDNLIRVI